MSEISLNDAVNRNLDYSFTINSIIDQSLKTKAVSHSYVI